MDSKQIILKMLEAKKGSYVKLKKFKDLGDGYSKVTDMVIRMGIDYYNIEENKDKPRQGLPWGEYVLGLEGYVIQNKGQLYLRVYDNGTNISSKSKYLLNGQEVNKDDVIAVLGDKKLASSKSTCYTIKFENILELGN